MTSEKICKGCGKNITGLWVCDFPDYFHSSCFDTYDRKSRAPATQDKFKFVVGPTTTFPEWIKGCNAIALAAGMTEVTFSIGDEGDDEMILTNHEGVRAMRGDNVKYSNMKKPELIKACEQLASTIQSMQHEKEAAFGRIIQAKKERGIFEEDLKSLQLRHDSLITENLTVKKAYEDVFCLQMNKMLEIQREYIEEE